MRFDFDSAESKELWRGGMSTGEKKWLGLHLGGVNTPRSAVVVIDLKNHFPQVANVLEKIGPLGNLGVD